jgi:hypothetical protein
MNSEYVTYRRVFSKVDHRKYEEVIEGKPIYLFQELLMEAFRTQFLNVITTPGGSSVGFLSTHTGQI